MRYSDIKLPVYRLVFLKNIFVHSFVSFLKTLLMCHNDIMNVLALLIKINKWVTISFPQCYILFKITKKINYQRGWYKSVSECVNAGDLINHKAQLSNFRPLNQLKQHACTFRHCMIHPPHVPVSRASSPDLPPPARCRPVGHVSPPPRGVPSCDPVPPHWPHSLNANGKIVNNCRRPSLMRSGTDMCQIIQFIWDLPGGQAYSDHVASIKTSHAGGARHGATPERRAVSRRHPGNVRLATTPSRFLSDGH